MTDNNLQVAHLRVLLNSLEEAILVSIQTFERQSGMSVHSIRVMRGDLRNGRRICEQVEVVAQLR